MTGASRGIGRGIAEGLAAEGASVAVNYPPLEAEAEHAREAVDLIRSDGGDAFVVEGDVSDETSAQRMISEAEDRVGDDNDRDPLWLCKNMPAEPSIEFEQVETSSAIFADEGLRLDEPDGDDQYYATFVTEAGDLGRLHDEASGAVVELIEGTDFDTHAVLVAQNGWGSGSKTPHLKRIEETSDGIHAFGCYRQPCI